jgi:DNA replication protein DnaC
VKRLYKDIMREYEIIRDTQERLLQGKRQQVYNKIPRLKTLDAELSQIGVELARAVFSNPDRAEDAALQIQSIARKLKRERMVLLTDHNFPIDYLDLKYTCSLCKDTGFDEHQKRCICFKQKLINLAYNMSNLGPRLLKENFDSFTLDIFDSAKNDGQPLSIRELMSMHYATAESFVREFKLSNGDNLLLYGNTGLGKTFLCSCIAKSLIDQGFSVIYQTSFQLMDTVGRYKFSDKQDSTLREAYEMLFHVDLLIIDDLGTEMVNSFTQTEVFNMINSRLLTERKTVISTNLTPIELSQAYGERTSSRIFGSYQVLEFYGKDLRLL